MVDKSSKKIIIFDSSRPKDVSFVVFSVDHTTDVVIHTVEASCPDLDHHHLLGGSRSKVGGSSSEHLLHAVGDTNGGVGFELATEGYVSFDSFIHGRAGTLGSVNFISEEEGDEKIEACEIKTWILF